MKRITTIFVLACSMAACSAPQPIEDHDLPERYSGPIIDMHIHAYDDSQPMFGMPHPPTLRGDTYQSVSTPLEQWESTLEQFERHNIVKALTSDGQLWVDDDPDRILVSARNLSEEELVALHAAGKLDAIGELNPFYAGITADHPSQEPLFALADRLGVPVGFHIMPGGPPGAIYILGMKDVRVANANPLQLEEVLVRHPNLKVYVMHGGWPYVEDMKAMLYAHPQLYVDISAINWALPEAELHAYLRSLVDAGFGDRIMFGSDQMVWPATIGIAINSVNSSDLTLEQKAAIFYDNAARFLGLSKEEIAAHKRRVVN
jgi:predicted TIM-barrel fold metal-dependent hydrolase